MSVTNVSGTGEIKYPTIDSNIFILTSDIETHFSDAKELNERAQKNRDFIKATCNHGTPVKPKLRPYINKHITHSIASLHQWKKVVEYYNIFTQNMANLRSSLENNFEIGMVYIQTQNIPDNAPIELANCITLYQKSEDDVISEMEKWSVLCLKEMDIWRTITTINGTPNAVPI
jgi:hypothetical protein